MHLFFRLPNDRDCGLLCCGPLGSVPKKLTEMHVSRQMTNLVDVEVQVDGYPEELYESIMKTFSKEGDLVLDVGSGKGKFGFCCFLQHVSNRVKYFAMPSCSICQHL